MSVLMLVLLFTCMSVLKALQSVVCFYTPTLNKIVSVSVQDKKSQAKKVTIIICEKSQFNYIM